MLWQNVTVDSLELIHILLCQVGGVFRSDDGSVISDDTINGLDILNRLINGLQWLPDLTSGDNNGTNSKLLVGPVNMTHNQSSYQCLFALVGGSVVSSVGTITVVCKTTIATV